MFFDSNILSYKMEKINMFILLFCKKRDIIFGIKKRERKDFMQVEREEILHIAKLACLKIEENEIEEYRKNLQDILDFANVVNNVNTENISETIGSTNNINVFREDEIKDFADKELLLQNAPTEEDNMFSIPKVI